VCVCEKERESVCVCEFLCVCERVSVCVCNRSFWRAVIKTQQMPKFVCVCVCVCVCVYERESVCWCSSVGVCGCVWVRKCVCVKLLVLAGCNRNIADAKVCVCERVSVCERESLCECVCVRV